MVFGASFAPKIRHVGDVRRTRREFYELCPFLSSRPTVIGSSGGEGEGENEIYVAAFGSHHFYYLFLQGLGGGRHGPLCPLDPLLPTHIISNFHFDNHLFIMAVKKRIRCIESRVHLTTLSLES